MHVLVISLMLSLTLLSSVRASEVTEFKLGLLEAGPDVFAYEISVLRLALEHSEVKTSLTVLPLQREQTRALADLEHGRGSFNVFFTGFSQEREERFLQVDFPITRGLLGHRVFVIRADRQDKLSRLTSLEDMKRNITIGSGIGWPDTEIFEAAGFRVVTSTYANLWGMVSAGRFDAFNRGIHEGFAEIEVRKRDYAELQIDHSVMIVYPFDYMFYLNKYDNKRGEVLRQGLLRAQENGSFMEHFHRHPMIQKMLRQADVPSRRVFTIDNPLMSERHKMVPASFWHRF